MTSNFKDPVILKAGPSYEDFEVVERTELPDDAFLTNVSESGEGHEGLDAGEWYDVYAVDRAEGIDDPVI